MTAEADGGRGRIRAADADRDRAAELLGTAYTEGRLSKDEYDARLEAAFSARTYADLDQLTADLPGQVAMTRPAASPVTAAAAKTNSLAVASLACGLGQFLVGPLATIPAIVLGHMAQHQIRRTGEQGALLAAAGLALGWAAVILGIVTLIAVSAVASSAGTVPVQIP